MWGGSFLVGCLSIYCCPGGSTRYLPKYVSLSDAVVLCRWWLKIKKFQKQSWSYSTFRVLGFVQYCMQNELLLDYYALYTCMRL